MRIALIGYGKMGKAIEQIATNSANPTNQIVLRCNSQHLPTAAELRQSADVAIEFSHPEAAFANLKTCFEAQVPVVCGTTGWTEHHLDKAIALCHQQSAKFLWASNFSIGVNLFFAINRYVANLMNQQPSYEVLLEEIHHIHKKDSPSGTAISLARDILAKLDQKTEWINHAQAQPNQLPIISHRLEEVNGTHVVSYVSDIDTIEIKHIAHSRLGFAQGALSAAEWLSKQPAGYYTMSDMLQFD